MDNHHAFVNKPTRLVVSGGGAKGLAALGGLHYIHECRGLARIEEYWGTSVGSVIALLLSIGYTPLEAFQQFFVSEQISAPQAHLFNLLQEAAFCHISLFGNKIRHFIGKKTNETDPDPTFSELHAKFNNKIHIVGTNTDTMRGECFDVDTAPNMKVIDAIEISCNLPFIFSRKMYNGQTYVDGGFINNYPVNLADNGLDYCLGICVFGKDPIVNNTVDWIYRLLTIPAMELHRDRISRLSNRFTNVELTVDNVSMLDISPSKKKKIEIFSAGYKQTKNVLEQKQREHEAVEQLLSVPVDANGADGWEWSDSDT